MDDLIRREPIEHPAEPGGFNGDIWYGHPEYRTLGTHRWDGKVWLVLPDVSDTLCLLLAKARNRIEELEASIRWVDEVYPARIEELDAKLATIDMDVLARVEAKLSAVLEACDRAKMHPRPGCGAGGMTIEANIRGSVYSGVDAWPVEEARDAHDDFRAMMEKINE